MNDNREQARSRRRVIVAKLHSEGLTNTQIGAALGITPSAAGGYVMRLNLIPNLEEKRPKTEVSLARAPWEQPSTDRSETAPRGRSYMVSTPRAQEPVEPSSIIATLRAVVEARA